jgi:hypothetical protein
MTSGQTLLVYKLNETIGVRKKSKQASKRFLSEPQIVTDLLAFDALRLAVN